MFPKQDPQGFAKGGNKPRLLGNHVSVGSITEIE